MSCVATPSFTLLCDHEYIYIYKDILILLPSESNPCQVRREKLYLTAAGIRTFDLRFTSPTLYQQSPHALLPAWPCSSVGRAPDL